MPQSIWSFLQTCWGVLSQLAPWLLLGTLLSGLMYVLLPPQLIRRNLRGAAGVFKSVLIGIPMPLCSCGVIPAGIGLKNQGASNGSAVGFLISTPQTGVDSILVAASFFGWPFALLKMVAAGVTGVVGGVLADRMPTEENDATDSCENQSGSDTAPRQREWRDLFVHGSEILQSIWGWLVLGILISALIEVAVPESWWQEVAAWGLWPALAVALVISLPLYVCATASVPIAAALVSGGLPPAAAMVFLMAGPATNLSTIGAIHGRFGWRVTGVYLGTLVAGSVLAAWLFHFLIAGVAGVAGGHHHETPAWWETLSGIVLAILLGRFAWEAARRRWKRRGPSSRPATEFPVKGMQCSSCSARLESGLGKLDGVERVEVERELGRVRIWGDVPQQTVVDSIESLGFQVPGTATESGEALESIQ